MRTLSAVFALATLLHLLPQAASAAPLPGPTSPEGSFTADYIGISHGLTVLKLTGTITLTRVSYAARVTFQTAGLVGMIVHSDNDSTAVGTFDQDRVAPQSFLGSGRLRGVDRATRIEYKDGNPVIRLLKPPVEQERTAVAPQDTLHTIDTLSAVASLIRQVGEHGSCDGAVRTFDGRRLAVQTVHTTGGEVLAKTSRSSFSGTALRCDFDGQQLAGFVRTENETDLKKPRHGTAWLASVVPGAPPVPVRIVFENRLLGQVTLYLTAVSGGPGTSVAACCTHGPNPLR